MIALIAYLFSPLTGVLVYFLEQDNEFARYHGAQSVVFGLSVIGLYVALTVVMLVLGVVAGAIPVLGVALEMLLWLVSLLVSLVLWLGVFLAWLFLVFKAYQGDVVHIPVVTPVAQKYLL
ncbi:hypothetical protein B1756_16970 [Natrarchaeobaculum aegyptiacum]|uniref:DUF4870 domain-containing protein n=1 Tax=Natrarchaeobaculum aegyptiacum TaxID=745377 RepID=A0A2Z2HVL5_9EURY|nr:hypothetical protein B1756_16970 [Natrarchaeobaculum aegyptiacum]